LFKFSATSQDSSTIVRSPNSTPIKVYTVLVVAGEDTLHGTSRTSGH
jgi:hypothetical protein